MFPRGWPGIGLLFLRASAAIALLIQGYLHRQGLSSWAEGISILLTITLFAGYLTPIAAAIGLLLHGLISFRLGGSIAAGEIMFGLDTIALILLGPGAYSVDGRLFGRRLLVPPEN